MKIRFFLSLSLLSLSLNSFADFGYTGDYCTFDGVSFNPKLTQEEEFAMLLSPPDSREFEIMAQAIAYISITPQATLKNLDCTMSTYAKNLAAYYQKYKKEIKNNNPEAANLLETIANAIATEKTDETNLPNEQKDL